MQQPTDEPETSQIKTLAAMLAGAEAALDRGETLSDMQGKAMLDRECCIEAQKLGKRRPPCVLPICWDGEGWRHGECWINDRGKETLHAVPSFSFWCDLMHWDNPWVKTIGVERARQIAMLLRHPESRTTCLKALKLLSPQEADLDTAETHRQFGLSLKRFGRVPRVSKLEIEAEEGADIGAATDHGRR